MHTPNDIFSAFFDFGKHVLSSAISSTGVLLCQLGNAIDATADSDAAEMYGPPGYYGLPANPTSGQGGTEVFTVKNSDHDAAVGFRDIRDSQIYGKLKPGERCIAGGFPQQNRFLQKANGDTWIYTLLGNVLGGKSLAWHQGADGSFAFQGAAARISADADGTLTLGNAGGGITVSPTGTVKIFGTVIQLQASGVAMISGDKATFVGPVPSPTPANAAAVATGPGPVAAVSTNVFISLTGK